ncbi:MAG TPA: hypothetical protein VJ986_05045 [Gaiellaceae bacterium]|nr:hypothetical protein [Gaiellaceae bacterium]
MLVLASLLGRKGPPPKLAALGEELGLSVSAVHRSMKSLQAAQLVDASRAPQLAQVDEFLTHALRYVFPPRMQGETRGVPTASSAPALRKKLAGSDRFPLVWPDPQGRERGIAFEPLHPAVPQVARRDRELGERLALFDAFRLNDARVRGIARRELQKRLAVTA